MEMLDLNEQALDVSEQADVDRLTQTIHEFQNKIYEPVENRLWQVIRKVLLPKKELLQVKEYYYRKKYLDRILAGLK